MPSLGNFGLKFENTIVIFDISTLKFVKLTKSGLPETVKLFVRSNLIPYNEEISFNCRELRRKGHI